MVVGGEYEWTAGVGSPSDCEFQSLAAADGAQAGASCAGAINAGDAGEAICGPCIMAKTQASVSEGEHAISDCCEDGTSKLSTEKRVRW